MKKHHLTHEEEMKGGKDSHMHKKTKKSHKMTAEKAKMAHVSPHKTKKSRSK
jgi:hypothetical protein